MSSALTPPAKEAKNKNKNNSNNNTKEPSNFNPTQLSLPLGEKKIREKKPVETGEIEKNHKIKNEKVEFLLLVLNILLIKFACGRSN